jgi:hypothetical protein
MSCHRTCNLQRLLPGASSMRFGFRRYRRLVFSGSGTTNSRANLGIAYGFVTFKGWIPGSARCRCAIRSYSGRQGAGWRFRPAPSGPEGKSFRRDLPGKTVWGLVAGSEKQTPPRRRPILPYPVSSPARHDMSAVEVCSCWLRGSSRSGEDLDTGDIAPRVSGGKPLLASWSANRNGMCLSPQ